MRNTFIFDYFSLSKKNVIRRKLEYFWSILREFESIDEDGHILNLTFYDTLEIHKISLFENFRKFIDFHEA